MKNSQPEIEELRAQVDGLMAGKNHQQQALLFVYMFRRISKAAMAMVFSVLSAEQSRRKMSKSKER